MARRRKQPRGRPPKFVEGDDGKPINGLSAQPFKLARRVRQRYYATFSKPRIWFGFRRADAIRQFLEWERSSARDIETPAVQTDNGIYVPHIPTLEELGVVDDDDDDDEKYDPPSDSVHPPSA